MRPSRRLRRAWGDRDRQYAEDMGRVAEVVERTFEGGKMNEIEKQNGNGDDRLPAPAVETATAAAAARAKAVVEARYVVAIKRPRNIEDVRVRLLKECTRPGFAEVAKYEKPVGKEKIVGLSVRFAEGALRLMGNVSIDAFTIFDDPTRRIVRVEVVDLETNCAYGQDIPIEKTVERTNPPRDREVLGQRTNTQGKIVYQVAATEDEFLNKQNAHVSKVIRNHGLRIVPGDILEECSRKIDETYDNKAAKDPDAEKKSILDSFAKLGILPTHLVAYLEHPLDSVVPAELAQLRRLYQSIRDGETTWTAIMEEKFGEGASGEGETTERPRPRRRSEAGSASSTSTEAPKQEQPAPPAESPPSAMGETAQSAMGQTTHPAAPSQGKPDFKLLSAIFEVMPAFNKKLGEAGAATRLLREEYGVEAPSSLTPAQAAEYLGKLKDWLAE